LWYTCCSYLNLERKDGEKMIDIPKDIYGVKIPKRLRKRLEIFCKGLIPLDLVNEIKSEDTHGFLAHIEWCIKNFPSVKIKKRRCSKWQEFLMSACLKSGKS
jgi:hypothetical protein